MTVLWDRTDQFLGLAGELNAVGHKVTPFSTHLTKPSASCRERVPHEPGRYNTVALRS